MIEWNLRSVFFWISSRVTPEAAHKKWTMRESVAEFAYSQSLRQEHKSRVVGTTTKQKRSLPLERSNRELLDDMQTELSLLMAPVGGAVDPATAGAEPTLDGTELGTTLWRRSPLSLSILSSTPLFI